MKIAANNTCYRIKDWAKRFESAKSRDYKLKSQTYMPNKMGVGYMRIMREPDGPAIYGAWCALVGLLSRQEGPRHGYLTDTGKGTGEALDAGTIAMLTLMPVEITRRMIEICTAQGVAWLEVARLTDTATDTAKDTARIPAGIADGPSPLPLPSPLPSPSPPPFPSPSSSAGSCNECDKSLLSMVSAIKSARLEYGGLNDMDLANALRACDDRKGLMHAVNRWVADQANAIEPLKVPLASVRKMVARAAGIDDKGGHMTPSQRRDAEQRRIAAGARG